MRGWRVDGDCAQARRGWRMRRAFGGADKSPKHVAPSHRILKTGRNASVTPSKKSRHDKKSRKKTGKLKPPYLEDRITSLSLMTLLCSCNSLLRWLALDPCPGLSFRWLGCLGDCCFLRVGLGLHALTSQRQRSPPEHPSATTSSVPSTPFPNRSIKHTYPHTQTCHLHRNDHLLAGHPRPPPQPPDPPTPMAAPAPRERKTTSTSRHTSANSPSTSAVSTTPTMPCNISDAQLRPTAADSSTTAAC
jgi:hypothetical protein